MCAPGTGKGCSVLRCVRLLLALTAAAGFAYSAMAHVDELADLPSSFPTDDPIYTGYSALRAAPPVCWQSAETLATDAPGIPQSQRPASPQESQTDTTPPDRRDRIFYPGDTESLKPLGRKLVLNILLDQKEIFTSPLHINRDNAKWWLLSGAVTAGLIAEDRRIANSFENSHGQVQWGGRISQLGAPYTVVPLVASYYVFGVVADHAKAREIGVLGTESLLDSLFTVEVLKLVFRRNRPYQNKPGDFWGGGDSFPSGHSIQVWSVASLVSHEYKHHPIVAVVAYSLAGLVSAARIAARQHFASDVFVGGTMGWFIGGYVYDTHMSHLAHKHATLVPMIVPQVQVATRTYGVTLLFAR
jgi:membrane-associated phospholipid phosphatase